MIASIKGYVEIVKELLQADININQQAKVRDVCIAQHYVPNSYTYTVCVYVDQTLRYEGRDDMNCYE